MQARKGRIIGKEEIKASLVERLGDLAMRQAWQAAGMADRLIEDSIAYDDVDSFDPDADFTFAVEADIVPEVRWTQPYRDLQVSHLSPPLNDIKGCPCMPEVCVQLIGCCSWSATPHTFRNQQTHQLCRWS